LLIIGDSKMSAIKSRTAIAVGNDCYLTPLPHEKSEPELLDQLLSQFQAGGEKLVPVFLPQDIPDDGREPDPALAIAEGFEVSRTQTRRMAGNKVSWAERCLVVRSFSYQQTMQASLERRLAKAEAALRQLTPTPGRGKRQILQMAVVKTAPIERRVNDGAEPIRVRFQTADYLFRRPRRPQLLSSCHGGVHDDQRKSKGAH
jgi:hypothetical protein